MNTDGEIKEALCNYGFEPGPEYCQGIRIYISLLLRWNRKISLTKVTDPLEIIKFHFGESVFASSFVPIRNGRLADVGSGAGFPGIPLAMASRELNVTLIEPNAKKCAFLSEILRSLGLTNANVLRSRIESAAQSVRALDFVTSRAVGRFQELLSWAGEHLDPHGELVLWVGADDASRISATSGWIWRERVRIPGSHRRELLVGSQRV